VALHKGGLSCTSISNEDELKVGDHLFCLHQENNENEHEVDRKEVPFDDDCDDDPLMMISAGRR
jgi:hypothetical protein